MLPAKERLILPRVLPEAPFLSSKPSPNAVPSSCSAWQGSCQWCRKKMTQERKGKVLNPWWWPQRSAELRETDTQHWTLAVNLSQNFGDVDLRDQERLRFENRSDNPLLQYCGDQKSIKGLVCKGGKESKCFFLLFSYLQFKNTEIIKCVT